MIWGLLFALLPHCGMEDDPWCKWDASVAGNGMGTDFVTIGHEYTWRRP